MRLSVMVHTDGGTRGKRDCCPSGGGIFTRNFASATIGSMESSSSPPSPKARTKIAQPGRMRVDFSRNLAQIRPTSPKFG